MKSRWMVHKGIEILYGDFSGFGRDVDALRAEVKEVDAEMFRRPPGSVLTLADLNGTATPAEVVDLFKASAAATRKHVARQAVVGLTGVQKMLAQSVAFFSGQSMHIFDSVDKALDWLAAGVAETDGGKPA